MSESLKSAEVLARAPDSEELVPVYNRSPATYKHKTKEGEVVIVPPGGSAQIPKNVAVGWDKVSGGLVTASATDPRVNNANDLLRLERARAEMLDKKVADLEARLASLQKK